VKTQELSNLQSESSFTLSNILEKILLESYTLIGENIDIDNTYDYKKEGSSIWSFIDKNNIKHYTKVNYNPGVKDKQITIKFFWVEEDNKPRYDKPPYTDEKVFNTHLKIFITEILPLMKSYEDHFGIDYITLDPTDEIRYRLYRIALNSILNKSEYEMKEDEKKNLLFIKRKK
jgi:hypothetical protein